MFRLIPLPLGRASALVALFVDVVDVLKKGGRVGLNPTHVSEGDHPISQRAKFAAGTVTIRVVP
jgi:hypothetical protein